MVAWMYSLFILFYGILFGLISGMMVYFSVIVWIIWMSQSERTYSCVYVSLFCSVKMMLKCKKKKKKKKKKYR